MTGPKITRTMCTFFGPLASSTYNSAQSRTYTLREEHACCFRTHTPPFANLQAVKQISRKPHGGGCAQPSRRTPPLFANLAVAENKSDKCGKNKESKKKMASS
ncbi:hypothetical protein MGG_16292 [Pyricularia oryzae 70-15]|uniref:Uncharacterized protein n=1 Tax=Pyricularia oryzae (strain 70-15 / ATCC MYA-4617 / FGSC 8958) TaxID=242507 RepID=G4MR65_PYRO7|nr:uncharacterized protein MGG_16292 [Pyricularia oryzae 70-15]EHA57397.1 hypothetical protein MGG_16292 [Pyricularia oryzae 70-15]